MVFQSRSGNIFPHLHFTSIWFHLIGKVQSKQSVFRSFQITEIQHTHYCLVVIRLNKLSSQYFQFIRVFVQRSHP